MAKILVVDDEANIRKIVRQVLELEGYAVLTAEHLAAARSLLATGDVDLCLLDVRLPDGSGLSLLAELAERPEPPAVVMMSGEATIQDAVFAISHGAKDFLEKPVGQDRLLVTIKNALELTRLASENARLRETHGERSAEIVGRSPAIVELKEQLARVAESEGRVLITGENGTGKELIARAIHEASPRRDRPFVSLNSSAVPSELIESELFGHEKGAFTGALRQKAGKFERAHRGTLFLDEVGDMPPAMQVKLLRVLETGEIERVGGQGPVRVDVRVLSATNKDLEREVAEGRFREDLFYRLNVVPLRAPALRDRRSDIPLLAERFLAEASEKNRRRAPALTDRARALLASHDYPGNVRELRNLMERLVILSPKDAEPLDDAFVGRFLPAATRRPSAVTYRAGARLADLVDEAERAIVVEALEAHGGVIADAARALGVERSNFHKKLKALGIKS